MKTGKGFIFRILPALVLAVLIQSVFVSGALAADPAIQVEDPTGTDITTSADFPTIDFGNVYKGQPVLITITIKNISTSGALTLTNTSPNYVTLMGGSSDFSIVTQPSSSSVAYNSSTTVVVKFKPTSIASLANAIVINSDDANFNDALVFSLGGVGITPPDPTIDAGGISPSSGTTAGGTSVTITGTNFVTGLTTVTIGGAACTGVTVAAGGLSLTCTTPTGTAGPPAVDVVVTNTDAAIPTDTLATAFTYTNVAPTATVAAFSGTIKEGVLLTSGAYTYADADSDAEGSSTFQWYTGTSNTCAGKAVISGETGTIATGGTKTYTPVAGDVGKYIYASVLHPKLLPARLRVRNL